jgi:hypothetical protein
MYYSLFYSLRFYISVVSFLLFHFFLFQFCCFIYVMSFLSILFYLTSFLVKIKCWISFSTTTLFCKVLLINNNQVTQLVMMFPLEASLKLLSASTVVL